jgi:hypothetical protein
LQLINPSTLPNELKTMLIPLGMTHGNACFPYFNKIWGIIRLVPASVSHYAVAKDTDLKREVFERLASVFLSTLYERVGGFSRSVGRFGSAGLETPIRSLAIDGWPMHHITSMLAGEPVGRCSGGALGPRR